MEWQPRICLNRRSSRPSQCGLQEADEHSFLAFYRRALALRRALQTDERLTWVSSPHEVVHFERPNGWHSVTNFGSTPLPLPDGELLITSGPFDEDLLSPDTTAWLRQ